MPALSTLTSFFVATARSCCSAGLRACMPPASYASRQVITKTARTSRKPPRANSPKTGIIVKPASLRMVLAMHQRNPEGSARFGFFFEPDAWDGDPGNREPHKHTEMLWADPGDLPADTVGYTAAALAVIEQGAIFTINGWDDPDNAAGDQAGRS